MMPTRHRTAQERRSSPALLAMPLLLLASLACSSAVEPLSSVTLQVRNATCDPGPCQAIRVLAFPDKQPLTPGGMWSIDLGVVTTAMACVTLPPSAAFTVTEVPSNAVTVTTWTTRDGVSLGPWPPSTARFTAGPTTLSFVPATASAWSVTLPGSAAPVAAEACAS